MTRRKLLSSDAIQELVRLAIPRDSVKIFQHQEPGRLRTSVVVDGDTRRDVMISIYRNRTVVSWVMDGHSVNMVARPGEIDASHSLDTLNLIRTAVGWLIGETLPPWPDLTVPWEWDDPDVGIPAKTAQDHAGRTDGVSGGSRDVDCGDAAGGAK